MFPEECTFIFHFGGYWDKTENWSFDGFDHDVLVDDLKLMSFECIKKHYSELGFPNPKGIYVYDTDKNFEEGLYLIKDEESCRKTIQYMEIVNENKIEFFIDDDEMPLPISLVPSILPTEVVNCGNGGEPGGHDDYEMIEREDEAWGSRDGGIGEGEDKHTVFLDKKLCTCRRWELTGIPCCHAIAAMCFSKIDPMSMISNWYHKSMYQKAYEYTIKPVPGVKFFKKELHAPIEPPPREKMTGRPRKNRIRAQNEPSSSTRLSRKGQIQRCSICKDTGHKKTFCPTTPSHVIGISQSSTSTRPTKMPVRRKTVGIGCHVNLSTGQTTINPG